MPVVPDWYCCLAAALDEEEEQSYNEQFYSYISAGGDPKKFPKRRQRYTVPAEGKGRAAGKNPFDMVMGGLRASGIRVPAVKGNLEDFASIVGLKKVLQMPDGSLVDEGGNPVQAAPGAVLLPVKK